MTIPKNVPAELGIDENTDMNVLTGDRTLLRMRIPGLSMVTVACLLGLVADTPEADEL